MHVPVWLRAASFQGEPRDPRPDTPTNLNLTLQNHCRNSGRGEDVFRYIEYTTPPNHSGETMFHSCVQRGAFQIHMHSAYTAASISTIMRTIICRGGFLPSADITAKEALSKQGKPQAAKL